MIVSGLDICHWIEHSATAEWVRDSFWAFPTIETGHLFGIILLVGATSVLDLRLLGFLFEDQAVSKIAKSMLPWALAGLVVEIVTGALLFASEAVKCYQNVPFRVKMLGIILAGVNAVAFHHFTYRSVKEWDSDPIAPAGARVAGVLSILLWFGIVAAGRLISYI